MLSLLPFLIVLAAGPAPAPTEAPHVTPLTEIGRVRSTPICTPIVVHANGAITSALDNDRSLAILTTNLRAMDFDRLNSMQLHRTIEDLMKQAGTIRQNGKLADNEIKQLRPMPQPRPIRNARRNSRPSPTRSAAPSTGRRKPPPSS